MPSLTGRPEPDCRSDFRSRGGGLAALLLIMIFALGGCIGPGGPLPPDFNPPTGTARIDGVPFHPQDDYQCGPASLASVLNFHGDPVTPDQIARDIFRRDLGGALSLDMVLYARKRGHRAEWYNGGPDDIIRAVARNRPLIIMVDYGFANLSKNHFMVVIGYGPDGVIAHNGRAREARIPWSDLVGPWRRANSWTLRIEPGSQP